MSRSPTAQRLVEAAISHFSTRNYDAASLSEIAESVGIRKASLYAHFPNKDALFMAAYVESYSLEKEVACQCFAAEPENKLPGFHYCEELLARYGKSDQLRFFLRNSYMPPVILAKQIDECYENYLTQLREAFVEKLLIWLGPQRSLSNTAVALYAQAYLAVVDSVQVKLIYTDAKQAAIRLNALQHVLNDALKQANTKEGAS